MSINQLLIDEHKEWLNPRVNDLTIDGTLTVDTLSANNLAANNLNVFVQATINNSTLTGNTITQNVTTNGNLQVTGNTILGTNAGNSVTNNGQLINQGNATINGSVLNASIQYRNNEPGASFVNMDYYETYSDNNFIMTGPYVTPQPCQLRIVRIGSYVSITIEGFFFVSNASLPIVSQIGVPARFRKPVVVVPEEILIALPVVSGGVVQLGNLRINNNGVITIYADVDTASFANSGSAGINRGVTISYNIN